MSIKLGKRIVIVCGFVLVAMIALQQVLTTYFMAKGRARNRDLASSFQAGRIPNLAKPEKYFDVKIESVGGIPKNGEQELTLKGSITLKQKIEGEIEYRWLIPPEAQLVSGLLEDSWAKLPIGQPAEIQITITGVSLENASSLVILHVENEQAKGVKIGNSAVFAPTAATVSVSPQMHTEKQELPRQSHVQF